MVKIASYSFNTHSCNKLLKRHKELLYLDIWDFYVQNGVMHWLGFKSNDNRVINFTYVINTTNKTGEFIAASISSLEHIAEQYWTPTKVYDVCAGSVGRTPSIPFKHLHEKVIDALIFKAHLFNMPKSF